jgi:predicted TIM-barrel fold metal-dependent hydrolase
MHKLLPLLFFAASPAAAQEAGAPVIDMHAHAYTVDFVAGASICPGSSGVPIPTVDPRDAFDPVELSRCAAPIAAPATDAALMDESIAAMRRFNIRRAVTSGDPDSVAKWRAAAPDLIVPALGFGASEPVSVETLTALADEGRLAVLGESFTQYRGIRADDPQWEAYWAFAEARDIPVGLHLGEGPPATARFPGYESYRASLTSPFQLEAVLHAHPKLRLYVMHYASPLVDEMIAMMYAHPNLYVDISANVGMAPRAQFYDHLKRMVDAGFGKRIMWGSDQMQWPGIIGESVASIEEAPFLTAEQRRDIFYNNAARFLRLSPEEIARDHAPRD